jgi:succinate dehydrogenase/fumarate reductase flavoprotein subunit
MIHLTTDVLIVGAGGAGMYAAVAAARAGAKVILADKSLISRGGATVMAQMTVAAAVGEECDDRWEDHYADTIAAGRELCDEALAAILCEGAPIRIREMDEWGVGWARGANGRMRQVTAPGHGTPRCVYVDFLNTGPAVAKTLRTQVAQSGAITRISGLAINDIVVRDGRACGAVGLHQADSEPVSIAAGAVVLAAGGLTRLYARNSASFNMGGDAYALALRAGAELVDMEFPQFFPIGHLAPRLVGMDPIMWDPFRYKLGGRLLNGVGEEFVEKYGQSDSGKYTAMRDVISYAIVKEIESGKGSPAGGVYLSFEHIAPDALREAFGPVIDRLAKNGIDLAKRPIEVSPIAHYHMGGIKVDARMQTRVAGLFAAGEAVGGANGANRLSGNAIPEALVFGERAGRVAAAAGGSRGWEATDAARPVDELAALKSRARPNGKPNADSGALWRELQALMWSKVGLLRDEAGLAAALARVRDLRRDDLARLSPPAVSGYNMELQGWFDLRAALLTAESVIVAALNRRETRGAHQREDFPAADPAQARNQVVRLDGADPVLA